MDTNDEGPSAELAELKNLGSSSVLGAQEAGLDLRAIYWRAQRNRYHGGKCGNPVTVRMSRQAAKLF